MTAVRTRESPTQPVHSGGRRWRWKWILAFVLVAGIVGIVTILMSGSDEQSLSNGDFETGDLTDWTVDSSMASSQYWGGWFVYEDGLTPPTDDARTPLGPNVFEVFDPPQGDYAAVTDSNAPGLKILYRDFVVDGPSVLRATVFYNTKFSDGYGETQIIAPDHFRVGSSPDAPANQQYRIDLIDPAASRYSLADEDVLGTVFRTVEGDPVSLEPTEVIFDLSPWEGQTIRLRAVEVDNRGVFFAGIDDVRIEPAD
jgi:hypothetical protein